MLTDQEYKELTERVAKGKEILEGKWDSNDPEIKSWIAIWFNISDILLTEAIARKEFGDLGNWKNVRASAQAKIDKTNEQSKERRTNKGSISTNLFAISV